MNCDATEDGKRQWKTKDSASVLNDHLAADPDPVKIRLAEMARGRRVKRNNAFTASLTGVCLAVAAVKLYGFGASRLAPLAIALGIFAGLLYANAFEYALHRFLLHWGEGFLAQRHALHHDSTGAPNEARYVNFATSPLVVVFVFLLNAPPVFAAGHFLGAAAACGMFAGFTCYFVAYEEIHWRIHFGGWLPRWLIFARRHHMLHHAGFEGRHNVFLPICDWTFQRRAWTHGAPDPRA
jgi:Fatty acid hydroxylase superfamily